MVVIYMWGACMRVGNIQNYSVSNPISSVNSSKKVQSKHSNFSIPGRMVIAFTGDSKNMNQILNSTAETKGLGLASAYLGGAGDVGFELSQSLREQEGMDCRDFIPFFEHNNPRGGFKFLIHKGIRTEDLPDTMPAKFFVSANPGQDIVDVAKNLNVRISDIDYVIQDIPSGTGAEAKSKYCIIEPTSVKGVIKRPSTERLGDLTQVPYQLFKISKNNPKYNDYKSSDKDNYFVYTTESAKASKPYSYDPWGNVSFYSEIVASDQMRVLDDIIKNEKMNTEEFDFYNPSSAIMHDRPGCAFINHVSNSSAEGNKKANGMKIHKVDHNTLRTYQGTTGDPFQMFAVVASEADVETLKNLPQFPVIKKVFEHGMNSPAVSDEERRITSEVFLPYVEPFKDDFGAYNMTKIPIVGVQKNKKNASVGTVSYKHDLEMKSQETPQAAEGLTDSYNTIETFPVLNGASTKGLKLDDPDVPWGRGDNGLTEHRFEYTPIKYNGHNIAQVAKAKDKNAKWLTKLIYEASQEGPEELNKLFLNEMQISQGQKLIGRVSPIKDGEIFIVGFGRPDPQKGFPMSTGGALHFFKRDDVPAELKDKVKFFFGAGKWNEGSDDYQDMMRDYKEICELDGGRYKDNIMIGDCFMPQRLVACSHYDLYTARAEMCGITTLQSFAAGTPVGSTNTGGPADLIGSNGERGFLTDEAVLGRPEKYGLTWDNAGRQLERARVENQIPQVSNIIKSMIEQYTYDYEGYLEMSKRAIEEKTDWHNNTGLNKGMSANHRYMYTIFEIDKGWNARNKKPLHKLVGGFGTQKNSQKNKKSISYTA